MNGSAFLSFVLPPCAASLAVNLTDTSSTSSMSSTFSTRRAKSAYDVSKRQPSAPL